METVLLLQKIRQIKDSLGEVSLATIHQMLREAEECVLQIQRASPEQMRRESRALSLSTSKEGR